MSNVYLIVTLTMTFGAIACAGIAYNMSLERRRTRRMLELQVGDGMDVNLRDQELSASLFERALMPTLSLFAKAGKRLLPGYSNNAIQHRLILAGSPRKWTVERVTAMKLVGAVAGVFLGMLLAAAMGTNGLTFAGLVILFAVLGFFGPDAILARKADERQEEIRRTLPDVMDLLTISVEAGLAFDAALIEVMKIVPGPLSQEFTRLLQEMRLGLNRMDAFKHMEERTDVPELRSFILAIVQADSFGVSIAKVLRSQASELRIKRRQNAEEQAMKIPIKILFPMIFCVLPALFVVVLGPGAIRIAGTLFNLTD